MSSGGAMVPRHPALTTSSGRELAEARLNDQRRMGVLLQGAAVLSLLEQCDWHLPDAFADAAVRQDGSLAGVRAAPGRSRVPAQRQLRGLLIELMGTQERIAGRGAVRSHARNLAERWRQSIEPQPVDGIVAELLERLPLLWDDTMATARRGLVGVLRQGDEEWVWIPGPAAFRRNVERAAANAEEARDLLAGPDARQLWRSARGGDPARLQERGHWGWAASILGNRARETPTERLELARLQFAAGRFSQAVQELKGLRSLESRVLRLRCRAQLAEYHAVRRGLTPLAQSKLHDELLVEVAAVAARVLANRGDLEGAERWVQKALHVHDEEARLHALIVAAAAACDRSELEAACRQLDVSRESLRHSKLAWRWHRASGQVAMQAGRGEQVVEHLRAALGGSRRKLYGFQAGRLWNELGVGRALLGDLAGAEKAFRHAVRLLDGCEGPVGTGLARFNLAEIRVRRGRMRGVRAVLEASRASHRASGNRHGWVHDEALAARLELAGGHPAAAHRILAEALNQMKVDGFASSVELLQVLAARALGWMGRAREAATQLDEGGRDGLAELEPEERPAVWALAGRLDEARRAAAETSVEALWLPLLEGREAETAAWSIVRQLGSWRGERLVYDLARVAPREVPEEEKQWAAAELRRGGAHTLADGLERGAIGSWRAVVRYLQDHGDAERLLAEAGYPQARLVWLHPESLETLVAGEGGDASLVAPCAGATLELYAPQVDEPLRTLFAVVGERLERHPPVERRTPDVAGAELIGSAPAFADAVARTDRLAVEEAPILILGETGTGKELIARRIHAASPRAEKPMQALNCAAFAQSLIQSELFGHLKGAFTGATSDRVGILESGSGSTVFLDEIGDLAPAVQAMLLRTLQEGEVRPVGASRSRRIDVRIVAATHRDLDKLVAEGSFRADLFYRLNVGRVELPPLRERSGDIMSLACHFLQQIGGDRVPTLTRRARHALRAWSWPGNVRELENRLRAARALAGGEAIDTEHLELPERPAQPEGTLDEQLDDLRRRRIREAVEASGGNRAAAARRLGMTRQALAYQMKRLGIF